MYIEVYSILREYTKLFTICKTKKAIIERSLVK